jgi:hypothetical protein
LKAIVTTMTVKRKRCDLPEANDLEVIVAKKSCKFKNMFNLLFSKGTFDEL